MPIYAYRCQDCGFEKDQLQKISDPHLTECPSCGGQGFARILTAPAFQLKGSGWYVTDFRDQGAKGRKPGESGAPAGEATDSGGGTAAPSASAEGASSSGSKAEGAAASAAPAATPAASNPSGSAPASA
jgi:putative FmdB family regulatory protein